MEVISDISPWMFDHFKEKQKNRTGARGEK